jgi:hypothetical protein
MTSPQLIAGGTTSGTPAAPHGSLSTMTGNQSDPVLDAFGHKKLPDFHANHSLGGSAPMDLPTMMATPTIHDPGLFPKTI